MDKQEWRWLVTRVSLLGQFSLDLLETVGLKYGNPLEAYCGLSERQGIELTDSEAIGMLDSLFPRDMAVKLLQRAVIETGAAPKEETMRCNIDPEGLRQLTNWALRRMGMQGTIKPLQAQEDLEEWKEVFRGLEEFFPLSNLSRAR